MPPADPSSPLTVVLAGGGSGGHIFPNMAIADEIRSLEPAVQLHYVCSEREIDREILEGAGVAFTPIRAQPISLRPRAMLRFARRWGESVRTARALLRSMTVSQRRAVVVLTGGFVSAPIANAARAERVPVVLVNLDASPGKANRWAARMADVSMTIDGKAPDSWTRIRPIIRREAVAAGSKKECRARLGLDLDLNTVLITGASQGAASLNAFMCAFLKTRAADFEGWQVLHQAGAGGVDSLTRDYEVHGVRAVVVEFIAKMGDAWGAADVAVARAGAGIVGEVWANAIPTLFFPYPYHRDQHQRLNAAPLASCGGAIVVTDHIDAMRNVEDGGAKLSELLGDSALRESMQAALRGLGPTDGAAAVAQEALRLGGSGDGAYPVRSM